MSKLKFTDSYEVKEDIILRDHLALQRTKLANERTLLSYIRSFFYLIIAGIAFVQMEDFKNMKYVGEICIILSFVMLFIGLIRFYQLKKHLNLIYKEDAEKIKKRMENINN